MNMLRSSKRLVASNELVQQINCRCRLGYEAIVADIVVVFVVPQKSSEQMPQKASQIRPKHLKTCPENLPTETRK